jgi:hypothetical protein
VTGPRIFVAAIAFGLVSGSAAAPARDAREAKGWQPDVKAAKRYAKQRAGSVRFAVVDPRGDLHRFHASRTAPAASVFKAMLLVAYLRRDSVRKRDLRGADKALLKPMITRSDNVTATRVNAIVGSKIYRLARRARMRRFHWDPSVWGLSRSSARDQARFFDRLPRLVPKRHLPYARRLLSHVVGPQRWGVGRVPHRGWNLYFKGGWGSGSGRVDHQVARLTNGKASISLAIFTEFNPSHAYGKQTLRGVARRLLRDLPR